MRVHPSTISPKATKFQLPVAIALILCVGAYNFWGGKTVVRAPEEKKIEVVVAKEKIEAGTPLEKAKVALELRPVSTLPSDAITSLDNLKNKVAAGPIPAGYPLAVALLAEPAKLLPVSAVSKEPVKPEDPSEILLKQLEGTTVSISLSFPVEPPGRGSRLAVTLPSPQGDTLVLVPESWVEKTVGNQATLRVTADEALFLQSARTLGGFGFVSLASDGPSPYQDKAIKNIEDLRKLLNINKTGPTPDNPSSPGQKKGCVRTGSAWMTSEMVKYWICADGSIERDDGEPIH